MMTMDSNNSSNDGDVINKRRSQSILRGMVHAQAASYRPDSLPNKHRSSLSKSPRHDPHRIKRSTSVFCTTLSQIGLPEDTFDKTVIMTDKSHFKKSLERLKRYLSIPENYTPPDNVDLKKLQQILKKDLQRMKIKEYNEQLKISDREYQPSKPSQTRKSRRFSQADEEVSELFDQQQQKRQHYQSNPSINLLQQSQHNPQLYRSSSSIASKIPTPIKSPLTLTERPLSKMEMRIQRRQSCSGVAPRSSNSNLSQSLYEGSTRKSRKHSVDSANVVQFPEEF